MPATADTGVPNTRLLAALGIAKGLGVNAFQVAARAGISPCRLSLVAHGRLQPTQEVAARIAEALGQPRSTLFPDVVESGSVRPPREGLRDG